MRSLLCIKNNPSEKKNCLILTSHYIFYFISLSSFLWRKECNPISSLPEEWVLMMSMSLINMPAEWERERERVLYLWEPFRSSWSKKSEKKRKEYLCIGEWSSERASAASSSNFIITLLQKNNGTENLPTSPALLCLGHIETFLFHVISISSSSE